MKNEKGITLIILVITVIILIILVVTTVQTGSLSISGVKLQNFTYEMQQIQGAVDKTYQRMTMDANTDYTYYASLNNGNPLGQNVGTSAEAMDLLEELKNIDYRTASINDTELYAKPRSKHI